VWYIHVSEMYLQNLKVECGVQDKLICCYTHTMMEEHLPIIESMVHHYAGHDKCSLTMHG
jgi:hypothetical protein